MSLQSDIESLVKSVDLELYDTAIVSENGESIYRVSVVSNEIKDGKRVGVSLERCVELTHLISPLLDVNPPVSGEYRLEVGSPGIERKLSTLSQFSKSLGEKVALTLIDKQKTRGIITKVKGSKIFIDVDDEIIEIDFDDIVKAKTYFEW